MKQDLEYKHLKKKSMDDYRSLKSPIRHILAQPGICCLERRPHAQVCQRFQAI